MKKLLIISYYWPPSGGAGVQRCLKYVKYLRNFGWEPVVFTPQNAHYPVLDESLKKDVPEKVEVIKGKIWEPYDLYRRLLGMKKGEKVQTGFLDEKKKPSKLKALSVWIRGNLFIPDARQYWINPSVKKLVQYLRHHPVDAILSSGPPHTTHIIARNVKRQLNIPWLADFRDPWTNIDFYDKLQLSKWADRKHKSMEQSVLKEADQVLTVSWHWAEDFKKLGCPNISVVTNGFDPADFEFDRPALSDKFTLSHIGSLNKDRNPPKLWEALATLAKEHPSFKEDLLIQFIGKTDYSVFDLLEQLGLKGNAKKIAYMPHNEVLQLTSSTQLLLLLINRTPNALGVVPGKIFEYLAAKRPILCIGPTAGDSARIVREAKGGAVIEFDDLATMKAQIWDYYQQYKAGSLVLKDTKIEQYSRKYLTGKMVERLNTIV